MTKDHNLQFLKTFNSVYAYDYAPEDLEAAVNFLFLQKRDPAESSGAKEFTELLQIYFRFY